MPTDPLTRVVAVLVPVALLLAGCGDDGVTATPSPVTTGADAADEDPTDEPTDAAASPTEESPGDPVEDPATGADESPVEGGDAVGTLAALEEARARWADNAGLLYVWGYREEGEGLVDEFCVEGVVGGTASDAAACPFEATPGGRSVESWFDTIASVLADADGTGRVADVDYDPATGHPTEMVFSGGGIDGLRVTSLGVEFAEDVSSVPDRDVESLASRCEAGFVSACYELGAAGEPLPPSLATGNELTQAPDVDVLDRCIVGEPAACHEAGARGLEGEQPTS